MANTVEIIIKGTNATGAAFSAVGNGLQGLRSGLKAAGKSLKATGTMITAGVTLPLTLLGKAALDVAMDYEASMNMFQAVTGATADEMAAAGRVAQQLGSDMSLPATSAADAGQAMTELAKAGLSVNDTLSASRGVLQLAAAGQLSNAEAARIAANALNAFGLEGSEATMVANLLAAAANSSSGEVKDMADALQMSSAVFAAAGVPIQDLTAAIGEMANKGIIGSDAGTSLKQMLLSLQAPSQKAAGLMRDLGINVYDAGGKMLPVREIIGQFSSKLSGLTQEQRNAALATIFGSDAIRAANIVLMGGVEAFDAMYGAVTREGAAAELAGARMKGLRGALEGLKSQIETLMLSVLTPFLPMLEGIVRDIAEFAGGLVNLNPEILKWGVIIVAAVAAAGPFLILLGAIATGLSAILSPIGLIILGVAALAAAYATNFLGMRDAVNAFAAVVTPFFNNLINWFQVAVPAALAFLGALWAEYWPKFYAAIAPVWQAIKTVIETVINEVVPFIVSQFQIVVDWVNTNWPLIEQTIRTVLDAVLAVVNFVLNAVRLGWEEHGATIISVATSAWEMIKTTVELVIRTILDIIKAVMQAITGDWDGAWETIKGICIRTWQALQDFLREGLNILKQIFGEKLAAIQTNWYNAWNWIKSKAIEIWTTIHDSIDARISAVRARISAILALIQASWYSAWNWIEGKGVEIWTNIHDSIRDKFTAIKNFLLDTFMAILRAFINVFSSMITRAGEAGAGIMRALKEGIGSVQIPLPRFSIEWRDGPMGIKIPSLEWDIVWRSVRDLIPQAFAKGGIVTRPTLALIGEAGPEAVVPLGGRYASKGLPDTGRTGERTVQLLTQIRDLLDQMANEQGPTFGGSDLAYTLAAQV